MLLEGFVSKWVGPGRQVRPQVKELFALGGKDLSETGLSEAVAQSQPWLREKGEERWNITGVLASMERLKVLLGELGLAEPVLPYSLDFDFAVILGATYRSMKHRLEALLRSGVRFNHLVAVTAFRVINDLEVEMISQLGLDPGGMTEHDAASMLFGTHLGLRGLTNRHSVRVYSAPNLEGGKRATTEETVQVFAGEIGLVDTVLWVGHQPFFRQVLTVWRALHQSSLDVQPHHLSFLMGPLFKFIEENPYGMVDAVGRTLYELDKLPDSFFA